MKEILYRLILKRPGEREEGDVAAENHVTLRHYAIDWLYLWLGLFTHLYGISVTILFFAQAADKWPKFVGFLMALQEPYLGALGVYVVLKEIRKRHHHLDSRHFGELFVFLWMLLLLSSSLFVLILPEYHFDSLYRLIITNSLATLIIYIGGILHRP